MCVCPSPRHSQKARGVQGIEKEDVFVSSLFMATLKQNIKRGRTTKMLKYFRRGCRSAR